MPNRIINSILDTDLYKLTMQQVVRECYPDRAVAYRLFLRTPRRFPEQFIDRLREQIAAMRDVHLTQGQRQFLARHCPYLKPEYLDWLEDYRFEPCQVDAFQVNDQVGLTIVGTWSEAILWEVPLMAMISELYFRTTMPRAELDAARENGVTLSRFKVARLRMMGASFSEFGTRRRFSREVQEGVVGNCVLYGGDAFVGTSNVELSMRLGRAPVGTMAHEWIMGNAVLQGYERANYYALHYWRDTYGGYPQLMTALTDTFTSKVFWDCFPEWIGHYGGVRCDSGDPWQFLEQALAFYQDHRIDPRSKKVIFSDGLDVDMVKRIHERCAGRIQDGYGIGTHLTNDVGVEPLNMVIKLVAVEREPGVWQDTVKLSDSPGKGLGSTEEVRRCRRVLGLKERMDE